MHAQQLELLEQLSTVTLLRYVRNRLNDTASLQDAYTDHDPMIDQVITACDDYLGHVMAQSVELPENYG